MSEHRTPPVAGPPAFDQEVSVRGVAAFIFGLTAFCLLAFALMWGVATFQKKASIARDPAPYPMADARRPRPRPLIALQADPTADMQTYRASEEKVVTGYGWVDRSAGIARIPVSRAIDILAEKGLPVVTGPPPASAPEASAR